MRDLADLLIASGEAARMIIIMPNAGDPDTHNQWNGYFNMPGRNYEDFFFLELIPTMEKHFRILGDKQHRAIMGLSMGGGGSTVYSQHHPELFSSCYAMSAWLDNNEPWSDNPQDKLFIVCQSVHEHSAIEFVKNADEATLAGLRTVKWFIDCGDDDFLLDLSLKLYQEMRNRGVKAELRVRDGWHCWEYWHQALRMSLPFATRNFGKAED
jgi:S-formylglutathione hydrolase FrmB